MVSAAPTEFVLYPRTHAIDIDMKPSDVGPDAVGDPLVVVTQAGLEASSGLRVAPAPAAHDAMYERAVEDSDSEVGVEELEPEGVADDAGVVDYGDHVWLWLTRTNGAATCSSCKGQIPKSSFRVIYHPFCNGIRQDQGLGNIFWKHYHISSACMGFVKEAPWHGMWPGSAGGRNQFQ